MRTFRLYLGRTTKASYGYRHITNAEVETFQRDTIDPAFDAYTVFDGMGRWKGHSERTTIIEVVTDESNRPALDYIAAEYTRRFHQDAVLITSHDTTFDLVEAKAVAA